MEEATGTVSSSGDGETQGSDEEVWTPTACYGCGRGPDLIRVRTVGGVAVGIEGNMEGANIAELSRTQGTTCAKCHQLLWKLYDPHRITGPLKRTNPEKGRGIDPKWVEIGWDEALDIVAEKLKEVKKKDPRLVACDERAPQMGPMRNSTPKISLSVYGVACPLIINQTTFLDLWVC